MQPQVLSFLRYSIFFSKFLVFDSTSSYRFNQDFEAKEKYSRKVTITNKTSKWAYIRFHKIYTEIWEPGIVEVSILQIFIKFLKLKRAYLKQYFRRRSKSWMPQGLNLAWTWWSTWNFHRYTKRKWWRILLSSPWARITTINTTNFAFTFIARRNLSNQFWSPRSLGWKLKLRSK